ncbi:MAG: hypothetical protein K6L80_07750 [Agarilytica sp.]
MNVSSPFCGSALITFLACLGLAHNSAAQTVSRGSDDFSAEIFFSPKSVDNAFGVSDASPLSERETQTEYGASLRSVWRSELTEFDVDYQYSETAFNKDSQQEGTFRVGESSLVLGNDNSFYQFTAEHSIRRVLRQPNAVVIDLGNSEERQISTVMPLLRARLNEANSVAVAYSFAQVDFEDSLANSSTRDDVQLQYLRNISPLSALQLSIGSREVDYDTSDEADYALTFGSLELTVEQRLFSYNIEVGYSEITPEEGEKDSSSTFEFIINSEVAGNAFEVFVSKLVSDTSTGNANDSFFAEEVSFDGGQDERDQVVRTAAGVSWEYEFLCARCTLTASLGSEKTEHFNFKINDTKEAFFDVALGYQFSRKLMGRFSYRQSKSKFPDPAALLIDSGSDVGRLELLYRVNRQFEISFEHEQDARDTDENETATVDTTALIFSFNFE